MNSGSKHEGFDMTSDTQGNRATEEQQDESAAGACLSAEFRGACCAICTKAHEWPDLYDVDVPKFSACYVCETCRDAVVSAPRAPWRP